MKVYADEQLTFGQSWRTSQVTMTMEDDGQLEIFNPTGQVEWSSDTVGTGVRAIMQADGNLVVYNQQVYGVWSSLTGGDQGAYLDLESNGNVVIMYQGKIVWSAGT